MSMTPSQVDYFSRAVRTLELEDYRVALSIMHNPYAKTAQDAARLGREMGEALARLRIPTVGRRWKASPGVALGTVARALRGAKVTRLSPEERAARQARDEAARERTRALLARVVARERTARGVGPVVEAPPSAEDGD
jgi:hypothetical protein